MFTFNFRKLLFVIIILLNNLVFANVNLNLSCQSEIISLFGHELRMVACADKVAKICYVGAGAPIESYNVPESFAVSSNLGRDQLISLPNVNMIIDPRLKDKKTLIDFYYAESDANTLVANGNADNTKDIFVYATNGQFTIFNPFTNECENASSIMKRIH